MWLTLRKRPVEMAGFSRACSRRSRDLATKALAVSETGAQPVLLVADLLHPLDRLAVERLLDGDVGHGGGGGGAMPMLLAGCEDHDVAGTNLLDRAAFALRPAAPCSDDEDLTERVGMPGRARARLETD